MRRTSIAALLVLGFALIAFQLPVASAAQTFQVVVHPDVEGSKIPRNILSSIFLKEVARWGSGQAVRPVDQSMRSPVRAAFTEEVLSRPVEGMGFYWADLIRKGIAPPPVKPNDEEVIEYVASHEGAIGYVTLGSTPPDTVKVLDIID